MNEADVIRVGLIDSGVAPELTRRMIDSRAFVLNAAGEVEQVRAHPDRLGHGTATSRALCYQAPQVEILNAQVFRDRNVTSPAVIAAALDWLVTQRVQVINMSFGLREDRRVLARAVARARAAGILLCAAAPARGAAVYPSAYEGVIRATGDARCGPDQHSWLNSPQADFGACPREIPAPDFAPDPDRDPPLPRAGGASLGAAHMTGRIVACLWRGESPASCLDALRDTAAYRGPERRFGRGESGRGAARKAGISIK